MKMTKIYCDICGKEFLPRQKEVEAVNDGIQLCGEPVYIRAFDCPHCGKIYVVSVMTEDMKRKLESGTLRYSKRKQLERKEKNLRTKYVLMLQKSGDSILNNV